MQNACQTMQAQFLQIVIKQEHLAETQTLRGYCGYAKCWLLQMINFVKRAKNFTLGALTYKNSAQNFGVFKLNFVGT